jgi:hypothetical protein
MAFQRSLIITAVVLKTPSGQGYEQVQAHAQLWKSQMEGDFNPGYTRTNMPSVEAAAPREAKKNKSPATGRSR